MSARRLAALRKTLRSENLDALIVSNLNHVRYLSGFTGSSGLLVVDRRRAYFFTDPRYDTQSRREVKGARVGIVGRPLSAGFARIPLLQKRYSTVGFERDHITMLECEEFAQRLNGSLLAPTRGLVERHAMVKDGSELAQIERAVRVTDETFTHALQFVKPGVRESELAAEMEYFMKLAGSSKPAFDTIVASGARSALPHGVASDKKLARGDLVTFDFGATVGGYVADMTRTVVVGKATARQKKIYDTVLRAQKAGIARVKSGRPAADVDRAARAVITRAGYGRRFGHGTGHGIGMYVHEGPRVADSSQDTLRRGMVVTVEPGIYLPGWGGVRIEDDVLVTSTGGRALNKSPKNLLEI
ncbi:MAG: M24 family metallopeptidase [Candidatus Zixiibacteriota bacterium]